MVYTRLKSLQKAYRRCRLYHYACYGGVYSRIGICTDDGQQKKMELSSKESGMSYALISGVQRQRLMIARAIAPKPRVLMFDEATSALDNITQKTVSESLDSLKCMRIVIAHRLSTIKQCDRILVLDKGKIIEDGTYDKLIQRGGFFAV